MSAGRWDDSHLWERMAAASTEEERKEVAGQVVLFHLGFFKQYAARNALGSWSEHDKDQFFQDVLLVALERAHHYDTTYVGQRGKATFPSYCRPYLQPLRYRTDGGRTAISIGIETKRLLAAAAELYGSDPTLSYEAISERLSELHGKKIGARRVRRLLQPHTVFSLDSPLVLEHGDEATTYADILRAAEDDPAEQVVRQLERDAASGIVSELLDRCGPFTEVERVLLLERLMAPPRMIDPSGDVIHPGPATLKELGARFGQSSETIRLVEVRLLARMRAELEEAGVDIPRPDAA